ncbi:MAG: DUF4231 domain-containing protein [Anaerolineales bacterium]|nr:DUF4231 domain-containing protein [Anaerolineales bacterium]MCB9144270.1 DUF4231 domain-containing protein [Anaerolineales bacterium]
MAEKEKKQELPTQIDDKYVLGLYDSKISYYWRASRSNKSAFKSYRTSTIVLGALVTLISSLAAAEFIQGAPFLRTVFAVVTPVIAATLTIMNGMGQNFQWGATWRDMVVNATRLERERDRFLATPPEKRNLEKELYKLNTIVLEETKNFFERVLDSDTRPVEKEEPEA